MATRMQQRRGTAQQWTDADPILAAGEIGFETDTNQFKIGDGVNAWSDLSYFKNLEDLGGSLDDYALANLIGAANGIASLDATGQVPVSQLGNIIDGAPELLNTINELADAINNDAVFANTVLTSIDAAQQAAQAYAIEAVGNAVTTHDNDVSNVHGIANTLALATRTYAEEYTDNALATTVTTVEGNLATHAAVTDNVHGIANTLALATMTYASNVASIAQTAAESTAADALSSHASDTTDIHGIANTAALATTSQVATAKQEAIDAAAVASENYADGLASNYDAAGTATGAVNTHNGLTANVHGIADTSKLVTTNATTQTLDGSLTIDGNLTVNGNTFAASSTSITIEDNLVQLAHQNSGNTVDLGIVVAYNDGTAKHSGLVRDVSDNEWKLFKDVTSEPTTTVNFAQGSLDNLELNNLVAAGVVFTDGTQTKEGVVSRTPIIQKTASYTLSALTERDSMIEVASSSATTVTIPTNSSVAYPVGTSIDVLQTSTGQVTIAGAAGVTVNATPGLKLRTQWSGATLFKRAENTWVVYGDLSA